MATGAPPPAPLEPKLLFANERTYLHWMHGCVTISSAGMVLAAGSGSSPTLLAAGGALSLLAIGLIWYAYATFIWRMDRITARTSARVDDRFGPMILAGSLLVALLASAAVTILRGNS